MIPFIITGCILVSVHNVLECLLIWLSYKYTRVHYASDINYSRELWIIKQVINRLYSYQKLILWTWVWYLLAPPLCLHLKTLLFYIVSNSTSSTLNICKPYWTPFSLPKLIPKDILPNSSITILISYYFACLTWLTLMILAPKCSSLRRTIGVTSSRTKTTISCWVFVCFNE